MVRVLVMAAATAVVTGDLELAAQLSGAYDRLAGPLGEIATPVKTLGLPDPAVQARAGLGDVPFERAYAARRALSIPEVAALLE